MARLFTSILLLCVLFGAIAAQTSAAPPPAGYRIGGIVVDALTGQPLGLTEVTLAPVTALDDLQTFLTAADGRFLFANLAPGKYRLMAGRRGYAIQGFDAHESYLTAIVAGPGQDTEHLRFRLSPSAVLTGVVSDQWNDPVREAEVLLFQQSWAGGSRTLHPVNRTTTNDLGRYRFAHLLPGTYVIGVVAHPWWRTLVALNVVVPQFLSMSGASSHVELVESNGSSTIAPEADTPSDAVALQSFQRVVPVPAAPNPALDLVYPVTYFPNATTLADAAKLSLLPGATETADVTLRPVPSIHLHVRVPMAAPTPVSNQTDGTDGEPTGLLQAVSAANVEVVLNASEDSPNNIPVSHAEIPVTRTEISPGLFELSGIPPGDAIIIVTGALGENDSAIRSQSLHLSASTDLDLIPHGPLADVSGLVLTQKDAAGTHANVAEQDSSPMSFQLVFRSRDTGESFRAPVSSKGEFSFAGSALPPGTYEVDLSFDQSLQVSSLEATGATVSHRTIDIPGGQPVKLTVHTSQAKCSLSGFALKDGKPFAGVMILLVPQDPDQNPALFHRDQSDSDGSFSMSPLFPGRYTLLALENGWDLEWSNPAVLFNYLPNGQPIEIQPNAALNLNAKVQ